MRHIIRGQKAEKRALRYLKKQGLRLIQTNYSYRGGEIDIIMQDQRTLVFVEVRYRHSLRYGTPVESVSAAKKHRIYKTACHFLTRNPHLQHTEQRFDIVGIHKDKIDWIKNAITVE